MRHLQGPENLDGLNLTYIYSHMYKVRICIYMERWDLKPSAYKSKDFNVKPRTRTELHRPSIKSTQIFFSK